MLIPYLLSRSLLIPSFLTSAPGTLDFLSPIVQSGHHSLQPFFVPGIEYGIDDKSLVLEVRDSDICLKILARII